MMNKCISSKVCLFNYYPQKSDFDSKMRMYPPDVKFEMQLAYEYID